MAAATDCRRAVGDLLARVERLRQQEAAEEALQAGHAHYVLTAREEIALLKNRGVMRQFPPNPRFLFLYFCSPFNLACTASVSKSWRRATAEAELRCYVAYARVRCPDIYHDHIAHHDDRLLIAAVKIQCGLNRNERGLAKVEWDLIKADLGIGGALMWMVSGSLSLVALRTLIAARVPRVPGA